MTGGDTLARARLARHDADKRVERARNELKLASVKAKAHLDVEDRTLKEIAAEIGVSTAQLSKLAPARRNAEWEPRGVVTLQALDRYTDGAYRLVALRARFDEANDALTEAESRLGLVEARTDVESAPPAFALPPLPPHFVPRPRKRAEVLRALTDLADGTGGAVGVSSAADLSGAGGYGKTTLALDVARQPETGRLFPDGIAFIEFGPRPSVVTLLSDWVSILDPDAPAVRYGSVEAASTAFMRALGDRRMLLVLDNVWAPEDLAPFLHGGPHCVRLVTSRRTDLLPPEAVGVDVDRMEPAEAVELLVREVPGAAEDDVFPLYARSARWPVVLGLLNGVLRSRTRGPAGRPVAEVVAALTARLDQSGVFATDDIAPDSERTAAAVLEISAEELVTNGDSTLLDRFIALAAFPPGTAIDFGLLERLWRCDALAVAAACTELAARSLLEAVGTAGARLHDVVHEHLLRSRSEQVRQVNAELVALLRARCPDGEWHRIPVADEQFLDQLAHHLVQSRREDELADLVRDFRFVVRRIAQGGPAQLDGDADRCAAAFADDPCRPRLSRVLRFAGHLVTRVTDLRSIAATLHSRVLEDAELLGWFRHVEEALSGGLAAIHPMPDRPDARLRSISVGHTEAVTCLAWRPDGEQLASGSSDGTVRLWTAAGSPVRTVHVGSGVVRLVWSPDRRHLAALTDSDSLVLIEPILGEVRATRLPGTDLSGLAWAPDSSAIAVGVAASMLSWDPYAGQPQGLWKLSLQEQVRDVVWPTRGPAVVTRSGVHGLLDGTTSGWHIPLDLPGSLLAWSPEGGRFAVAESGTRVCVVAADGSEATTEEIPGHWGTSLAWNHDGTMLACGGQQGEVLLWGPPGSGIADLPRNADGVTALDRQQGIDFRRTRVSALAWHPARPTLAVGSHTKDVRLFDLDRPPGLPDTTQVNCVRWHPNRLLVAAAAQDGELVLASAADPPDRWTFPVHEHEVRAVVFAPDGTALATLAEDGFALWEFTDHELHHVANPIEFRRGSALAWSSGNLVVLGGDGEVVLVDAMTWQTVARIEVDGPANSVDVHPGSGQIAITASGTTVLVHDPRTGRTRQLEGHTSTVSAARWERSGTLLSAGYDGRVLRWEVGTAPTLLAQHDAPVWDVAVDPTADRAFTVTTAGVLDELALDRSAPHHAQSVAVDGALAGVAVSPDGREVVACGASGLYFFRRT
ncbi:NB-ARC domain-containing protein [Saccharothrix sp. Mg75]|uniref:WD40 repeat domain-containing protein n=1 Tax=Saccharothrix sp. Mg75 TaxID=3445357 RepID=UPI003EEFE765